MQIGVFGGHDANSWGQCRHIAYDLGKLIGQAGHYLITGGSSGISEWAAEGARSVGGIVVGICPGQQPDPKKQQSIAYGPLSIVIETGMTYKLRNVVSILSSDVCIFVAGGYGTLNEFTIAVDHQRPCVILGSAGITRLVPQIVSAIPTPTRIALAATAQEAFDKAMTAQLIP